MSYSLTEIAENGVKGLGYFFDPLGWSSERDWGDRTAAKVVVTGLSVFAGIATVGLFHGGYHGIHKLVSYCTSTKKEPQDLIDGVVQQKAFLIDSDESLDSIEDIEIRKPPGIYKIKSSVGEVFSTYREQFLNDYAKVMSVIHKNRDYSTLLEDFGLQDEVQSQEVVYADSACKDLDSEDIEVKTAKLNELCKKTENQELASKETFGIYKKGDKFFINLFSGAGQPGADYSEGPEAGIDAHGVFLRFQDGWNSSSQDDKKWHRQRIELAVELEKQQNRIEGDTLYFENLGAAFVFLQYTGRYSGQDAIIEKYRDELADI